MSGFVEGWDRRQSALPSDKAKAAMGVEGLELLADAGDFSGEESLACEAMGVTPMCPSPSPREKAKGQRRRAFTQPRSSSLLPGDSGRTPSLWPAPYRVISHLYVCTFRCG